MAEPRPKQENLVQDFEQGFLDELINDFLTRFDLDEDIKEKTAKGLSDTILRLKNASERVLVETIVNVIRELEGVDDETKENILGAVIVEKDGEKHLSDDLQSLFGNTITIGRTVDRQNYEFRLEKGLSAEEAEIYTRAYVYLTLPDEKLQDPPAQWQKELEENIEQLLTQSRKNLLRRVRPGFAAHLQSNLNFLFRGKNRVTLSFTESTFQSLPEEIKNNYEQFGIIKEGNTYKIFLDQEKLMEVNRRRVNALKDIVVAREEVRRLFIEADELYKKAQKQFKDSPEILIGIDAQFKFIKQCLDEGKKKGFSETELENLKKTLKEGIIDPLRQMMGIAADQSLKPEEKQRKIKEIAGKVGKWFWENGKSFFSLLGTGALLWGAVFALYLPVLIVSAATKEVEKLKLGG